MKARRKSSLLTSMVLAGLLVGLSACGDQQPKDAGDGGELPTEIAQDDWVSAKQSVELDTGIDMKYVEMGNPDGKPLVLIHGMTDNSRGWSLMAPYLADEFHIYMPDLRGHGDTDKPDMKMYPISLYASDIASFMDQVDVDTADVVGHSLGSAVAQAFAINYSDRTDHLVLESSSPVKSGNTESYEEILGFGENPPSDEYMDNWYSNPNPVDEEFLSYEKEESRALPPYDWRQIAKGSSSSDLTPFMDEVDMPTLILWGTKDSLAGKTQQKELRKLIPDADFISYDGNGHNIQWEIPEKMAEDVQEFLTE